MEKVIKDLIETSWVNLGKAPTLTWLQGRIDKSPRTVQKALDNLIHKKQIVLENGAYKIKAAGDSKTLSILKIAALFVGIACILVSSYYSQIFFSRYMSIPLSYLLALVWVTSSVMFWQLVKQSVAEKFLIRFLIFTFLAIITTAFSMYCTVVVQYESYREKVEGAAAGTAELIVENTQVQSEYQTIVNAKNRIIAKQEQELELFKIYLNQMRDSPVGERLYQVAEWRKIETETRYGKLKLELDELEKTEKEFLANNREILNYVQKEAQGFDEYVDSLFPEVNTALWLFWWNTIPSVFVDLVAPAAIMIVLFGWEKRRKEG